MTYTGKQIASLLGISQAMITYWIKLGLKACKGPSGKIGGPTFKIEDADLISFLGMYESKKAEAATRKVRIWKEIIEAVKAEQERILVDAEAATKKRKGAA